MDITSGFFPTGRASGFGVTRPSSLDGGQLVRADEHVALGVELVEDLRELRLGRHVVQVPRPGLGVAEGTHRVDHQRVEEDVRHHRVVRPDLGGHRGGRRGLGRRFRRRARRGLRWRTSSSEPHWSGWSPARWSSAPVNSPKRTTVVVIVTGASAEDPPEVQPATPNALAASTAVTRRRVAAWRLWDGIEGLLGSDRRVRPVPGWHITARPARSAARNHRRYTDVRHPRRAGCCVRPSR